MTRPAMLRDSAMTALPRALIDRAYSVPPASRSAEYPD